MAERDVSDQPGIGADLRSFADDAIRSDGNTRANNGPRLDRAMGANPGISGDLGAGTDPSGRVNAWGSLSCGFEQGGRAGIGHLGVVRHQGRRGAINGILSRYNDGRGSGIRQKRAIARTGQKTELAGLSLIERRYPGDYRRRVTPLQARARHRGDLTQRDHASLLRGQALEHFFGDIHLRAGVQSRAVVDHQIEAIFLGDIIDDLQNLFLEFA